MEPSPIKAKDEAVKRYKSAGGVVEEHSHADASRIALSAMTLGPLLFRLVLGRFGVGYPSGRPPGLGCRINTGLSTDINWFL